jgi:uncharacterized protein (TIGR03437 family)
MIHFRRSDINIFDGGTVYRKIAVTALWAALVQFAHADISLTVNVPAGSRIDLDTGTVTSTGGDLLFNGMLLTPQGSAKVYSFGAVGQTGYNALTEAIARSSLTSTSVSTIGQGAVANAVFAVSTNGGNVAKLLITAAAGTSITIQFTTYGAGPTRGGGGGATAPAITAVLNNSSLIPSGFPNHGIAPSSLFIIRGTGMANDGTPALQDTTKGLPTTLNGANLTVAVNGVTTRPPIYYTSATQIAAVLPAATPVGSGTITVTYNGQTSAPFTIKVVPNALGFNTYYAGAVATDAVNGSLLTFTSSGTPGQIILLWSTGLGADPADSDSLYTSTPHTLNVDLQIYIGGARLADSDILFKGQSVYPGVSLLGVKIPANVTPGCYVSLAAVAGGVTSNVTTLPISRTAGPCSDAYTGLTGSQLQQQNIAPTTPTKVGLVYVAQTTFPSASGAPTTVYAAGAQFAQVTGYGTTKNPDIGGCTVSQTAGSTGGSSTLLNAGEIAVTGPSGAAIPLASSLAGNYLAQLPAGAIPTSGGSFVFRATAGTQVGAFTATVNFPNPVLSWTNQAAAASVNRSTGLTVNWDGGGAGTLVFIVGSSSAGGLTGTFTCIAPVEAKTFSVPSYILLALPPGSGTVSVQNQTKLGSFTAGGLDFGTAQGSVIFTVNSTFDAPTGGLQR